jgi:hypothetical protein
VNDILEAVRELLEPDPDPEPRDVALDETNAKPFDWRPSTLYMWPEAIAETGIESGPTARQDFSIAVVLTGSAEGEEADRLRSRDDLSDFLDERRDTYLAASARTSARPSGATCRPGPRPRRPPCSSARSASG